MQIFKYITITIILLLYTTNVYANTPSFSTMVDFGYELCKKGYVLSPIEELNSLAESKYLVYNNTDANIYFDYAHSVDNNEQIIGILQDWTLYTPFYSEFMEFREIYNSYDIISNNITSDVSNLSKFLDDVNYIPTELDICKFIILIGILVCIMCFILAPNKTILIFLVLLIAIFSIFLKIPETEVHPYLIATKYDYMHHCASHISKEYINQTLAEFDINISDVLDKTDNIEFICWFYNEYFSHPTEEIAQIKDKFVELGKYIKNNANSDLCLEQINKIK